MKVCSVVHDDDWSVWDDYFHHKLHGSRRLSLIGLHLSSEFDWKPKVNQTKLASPPPPTCNNWLGEEGSFNCKIEKQQAKTTGQKQTSPIDVRSWIENYLIINHHVRARWESGNARRNWWWGSKRRRKLTNLKQLFKWSRQKCNTMTMIEVVCFWEWLGLLVIEITIVKDRDLFH